MSRIIAVFTLLAALLVTCLPFAAADSQIGAERSKQPVSARIVLSGGGQRLGDERIGNVEVTYADGTKDRWTRKGDCGQAHVAADGMVGWTIYEAERYPPTVPYTVRNNDRLVLCRRGKIMTRIVSQKGFIEDWGFLNGSRQVALRTRALHGPALIERHESATGQLLESVNAYPSDLHTLPAWANLFTDR